MTNNIVFVNQDALTNKCKAIGNTIVCLNYLSSEARRDGVPEISDLIDASIKEILVSGSSLMTLSKNPTCEIKRAIDQVSNFVDEFCSIDDLTMRGALAELVFELSKNQ